MAPNSTVSTQEMTATGPKQSISSDTVIGIAPMLMLGFDTR
jgi:hypothetical protein